jgi:hypothetical protein
MWQLHKNQGAPDDRGFLPGLANQRKEMQTEWMSGSLIGLIH